MFESCIRRFVNSFYLQEALKELFPSMDTMRRHREVIQFTCGLMKDPRPLVEFVFQSCIEANLHTMRTDHCEEFCVIIDQDLLQAIYRESRIALPGKSLELELLKHYIMFDIKHAEGQIVLLVLYSKVKHSRRRKSSINITKHYQPLPPVPSHPILE